MNISHPKLPLSTSHDRLPLSVHFKVKIKFRSISVTKAERQKGTENQPRLKNFNLNLILTCNIHTLY